MPFRILMIAALLLLAACGGGSGPANGVPSAPAAASNQPPVAAARAEGPVAEGSVVTLDGTGSSDVDGIISSYVWRQTGGTAVALSGADAATATFTAPPVAGEALLTFQLTVTDDTGSAASARVAVSVMPARFTLSGTIIPAPGTAVDGDVNDQNAPYLPNDTAAQAQAIPSQVVLGGYVNVPGAGAGGPLRDRGDASDFFRVDLAAGRTVALLIADPDEGDPDLYLWDEGGSQLIDASLDTTSLEVVSPGAEGSYLVEVRAHTGASAYTLMTSQTPLPGVQGGLTLTQDFLPGEVILEWRERPARAAGLAGAGRAAPSSVTGAAVDVPSHEGGRPLLARLRDAPEMSTASAAVTDAAVARAAGAMTAEAWHKYQTLLAIKDLRRHGSVRYAQPNFRVRPRYTPGDPLYPLQWHYPRISLPRAWEYTRGDPSVTVAVVDTGVLFEHPDLAGRLLPGHDFVSSVDNGADGDGLDGDPTDPGDEPADRPSAFHGTHVAGTVAAAADNGRGGTGVAPDVRVLPVRSLGAEGGSSYDIMQGVRYAAGLDNDSGTQVPPSDVINLSLGRPGRCWPAEQAVFDAAREAGVVVVGAAGNDATDAADAFPANCRHVIGVGAVDRDGVITAYSNFGTGVDVLAPGGDHADRDADGRPDGVLSLRGDDTGEALTYGYGIKAGTSMASPHVAGVVALMKSLNPALTPAEIDLLLEAGLLTDEAGVIDAWRAVQAALNPGLPPEGARPALEVTPASLDFGSSFNHAVLEVRLRERGEGLVVGQPIADVPWLEIEEAADSTAEVRRYDVTVARRHASVGTNEARVTLVSSAEVVEIPVVMQAEDLSTQPGPSPIYALLIDVVSGAIVRQQMLTPRNGGFFFQFENIDAGPYAILAGSDLDNDMAICDGGEICGRYGGDGGFTLSADSFGGDFSIDYRATLPGHAAAGKGTARSAASETDPAPKPVRPAG